MRFDDHSDEEPVSVVRVMADFSLCLTLIVLMLVGTRSPSAPAAEERSTSRAATPQPGTTKVEMAVALRENGKFLELPILNLAAVPADGFTIVQQWVKSHGAIPANVVVQFPPKVLAADLHRGLLNLQSAFGTNVVTIQTSPVDTIQTFPASTQ